MQSYLVFIHFGCASQSALLLKFALPPMISHFKGGEFAFTHLLLTLTAMQQFPYKLRATEYAQNMHKIST